MTDDLDWMTPVDDPTRPERPAKVCRHRWGAAYTDVVYEADGNGYVVLPDGRNIAVGLGHTLTVPTPLPGEFACSRCGKLRDPALVRRGRNNRSRGNSIEREVGKQLGLRRVGQYGGPTDLVSEPFAVSVKSGSGYFSERYWDQLKRQPVQAGQTALLVVTDAPGPGHRRRAMVVIELSDWIENFGGGSASE
jgi:hypothetical protein